MILCCFLRCATLFSNRIERGDRKHAGKSGDFHAGGKGNEHQPRGAEGIRVAAVRQRPHQTDGAALWSEAVHAETAFSADGGRCLHVRLPPENPGARDEPPKPHVGVRKRLPRQLHHGYQRVPRPGDSPPRHAPILPGVSQCGGALLFERYGGAGGEFAKG